ncbi:hypothetical protein IKF81_01195 [Candidatus Saccharibacteria bacterium]|nr:hypothetical protein [Candidatus Saccharibacteria bacterium]
MKISEKVKIFLFAGVLALAGVGLVSLPTHAETTSNLINVGLEASGVSGGNESINRDVVVKTVVNWLLFIVGAASIIMIIWGGITYTTSAGDSAKVTKAKNIILYGIVGLVISLLSYAIVNLVITEVNNM